MSQPNHDFVVNNVNEFKALFTSNPKLMTEGQFYCRNHAWEAVLTITEAELLATGKQPVEVADAIHEFFEGAVGPNSQQARAVAQAIKQSKSEKAYPRTLQAFLPDPHATRWALGLYERTWGNDDIPAPPVMINPSADMIVQANGFEADKCFPVTIAMAKKYIKARKKPTIGPPWTPPATPAGSYQLGKPILSPDHSKVVYTDAAGLQKALDKLRDSMSVAHRFVYVVGVVSGAQYSRKDRHFPYPEHWLLVFANNDADIWLFWDSDSVTSDITTLGTGQGFGMLRVIPEHFSTAWTGQDFSNLGPGPAPDQTANYHSATPTRHRYQAYTAQPIPVS